jgi:hypothetical protein
MTSVGGFLSGRKLIGTDRSASVYECVRSRRYAASSRTAEIVPKDLVSDRGYGKNFPEAPKSCTLHTEKESQENAESTTYGMVHGFGIRLANLIQ